MMIIGIVILILVAQEGRKGEGGRDNATAQRRAADDSRYKRGAIGSAAAAKLPLILVVLDFRLGEVSKTLHGVGALETMRWSPVDLSIGQIKQEPIPSPQDSTNGPPKQVRRGDLALARQPFFTQLKRNEQIPVWFFCITVECRSPHEKRNR